MVKLDDSNLQCKGCHGINSAFYSRISGTDKPRVAKDTKFFSTCATCSQIVHDYRSSSSCIISADHTMTSTTSNSLLPHSSKDKDLQLDFFVAEAFVDGAAHDYYYITQAIVQHEKKMGHCRIQPDGIERSVKKAVLLCGAPGDVQFITVSRRIGGISYFCFRSHFCQEYLIFRHFYSGNIHLLSVSPLMQSHSAEGYVKTARVYMELGVFDYQNLLPLYDKNYSYVTPCGSSTLQTFISADDLLPTQAFSTTCYTAATTTASSLDYKMIERNISSIENAAASDYLQSCQNNAALPLITQRIPKVSSLIATRFNSIQDLATSPKCSWRYNKYVSFSTFKTVNTSSISSRGTKQRTESFENIDLTGIRYYFVQQANLNCESMFKRAMQLVLPDGPLQGLPNVCRPVAVRLLNFQSVAIFPLRCGDLRSLLHRDDCKVYREYLINNPKKMIELLIEICAAVKRLHQCTVNLNAFLGKKNFASKLNGLVHTDLKLENFLFDPIRFKCVKCMQSTSKNLHYLSSNYHIQSTSFAYLGRCEHADSLELSFLIELTDFDGLVNEGQKMQGNSTPGYVSPQMVVAHAERNGNYRASQPDDAWALGEVIKRLSKVILAPHTHTASLYKSYVYPLIKQLQQHDPSARLTIPEAYSHLCNFYRKLNSLDMHSSINSTFVASSFGGIKKDVITGKNKNVDELPTSRCTVQKLCNATPKLSSKCLVNGLFYRLAKKSNLRFSWLLSNDMCDNGKDSKVLPEQKVRSVTCHNENRKRIISSSNTRGTPQSNLNRFYLTVESCGVSKTKKELKDFSIASKGEKSVVSFHMNVNRNVDSSPSSEWNTDINSSFPVELENCHVKEVLLNGNSVEKCSQSLVPAFRNLSETTIPNFGCSMANELLSISPRNETAQFEVSTKHNNNSSKDISEVLIIPNEINETNDESEEPCYFIKNDDEQGVQVPCILSDGQIEYIKVPGYLSTTASPTVVSILSSSSTPVSSSPCVTHSSASAMQSPNYEFACSISRKLLPDTDSSDVDLGGTEAPRLPKYCQSKVILHEVSNGLNMINNFTGEISQIDSASLQQNTKDKGLANSPSGGVVTISTTTEGSPCSSIVYNGTTFIDLTSNNLNGDVDQSLSCSFSYLTDNSTSGRHSDTSTEDFPSKDPVRKSKLLAIPLPEEHAIGCLTGLPNDDASHDITERCAAVGGSVSEKGFNCSSFTPLFSVIKCYSTVSSVESAVAPRASMESYISASNSTFPNRCINLRRSLCRDHFLEVRNCKNIIQHKDKGLEQKSLHSCSNIVSADALHYFQLLDTKNTQVSIDVDFKEKKKFVNSEKFCSTGKLLHDLNLNCQERTDVNSLIKNNSNKETATCTEAEGNKTFDNAWNFLSCENNEKTKDLTINSSAHTVKPDRGKSFLTSANFLASDVCLKHEIVKEELYNVKKPKSSNSRSKRENISNKRSLTKGNGVQGVIKSLARKLFAAV